MRMKEMNEKKRRYGWCASVHLCSHPIDILGVQTVFLERDCKKRILISHLLKGNWNSKFLVV